MRTLFFLVAVFSSLVTARLAEAHIRLMSPTARFVQDDNGLKTGPCGTGTATGTITPLVPGQPFTVTWMESVPHAGHYRIALSASETAFVEPVDLTIPTTLASWDLVDGIQDKTGTQMYSQSIQVPNTPCPACVLQLLQIMSTGTDGTNTGPFSGVYHACADVSISVTSGDGGTARDSATALDTPPDILARDSADTAAATRDATSSAGGAMGTGGNGSGGSGVGGSVAGTGGAIGSGGRGSGGSNASAGGSISQGSGGSGGSVGGTTASTSGAGSGGATTGGGGSSASLGGGGGLATGAGGSTSSAGGSTSTTSSGVAGSGGNSQSGPNSSSSGCSCQLGAQTAPKGSMLLALLALGLGMFRRPRPGSGSLPRSKS